MFIELFISLRNNKNNPETLQIDSFNHAKKE